MRINVTGNAGAGKSTLAKQIADELAIPLIAMDSLIWQAGWKRTPQSEIQERLGRMLQAESWVLDGVTKLGRSKADHIIFIDIPRRLCAWRCLKRNTRFLFRSRPGLPEGCPEWRIILTLARIIRDFPRRTRPEILEDMSHSRHKHLIVNHSSKLANARELIQQLSQENSNGLPH